VDVLLDEAVEQDGQRGEADVVQGQVGRVVQRLGRAWSVALLCVLCVSVCVCECVCVCTPTCCEKPQKNW